MRIMFPILSVFVSTFTLVTTSSVQNIEYNPSRIFYRPLVAILSATSKPHCSVILIMDEGVSSESFNLPKNIQRNEAPRGISVIDLNHLNTGDNNSSSHKSKMLLVARKLRRTSWCVTIVVLSNDIRVLSSFAKDSLEKRLLVWSTRLLVVTQLTVGQIRTLMTDNWTFSMMNTIFISRDGTVMNSSWNLYRYFPYTATGPEVTKLGSWIESKGLQRSSQHAFFGPKYTNFHGAIVNVTSLPWAPYWMEKIVTTSDGKQRKIFFGSDGTMLHSIAASLNFTFYNIPCESWNQVMEKLSNRESYISPIRWTMLPQRLAIFDMTYVYDYSFVGFCMAKPPLKPQWQSMLYSLAIPVWVYIFASLLTTPACLYVLSAISGNLWSNETYSPGKVVMEVVGTFLGQNLSRSLPKTDSSRVLMVFWLIFSFNIGTAFRGNLTAHLTLPKFPPRTETVEELIEAVDAVNGAPYNVEFKKFFINSKYQVYRKLGELINPDMTIMEAMNQSVEDQRSAVIDIERYMGHIIADKFTKADGSTDLYIGKSGILPGRAAWGVPHDAPYTANLDWYIQAALESGLYNKWSQDVLERSKKESIRRQREHAQKMLDSDKATEDLSGEGQQTNKPLSLDHMQGPLFLFLVGSIMALLCFISEKTCCKSGSQK